MGAVSKDDFDKAVASLQQKANYGSLDSSRDTVIQQWAQLFAARIRAWLDANPGKTNWTIVAQSLNAIPVPAPVGADPPGTGACVYLLDGQPICANDVTQADCDQVQGTFFPGDTCS